MSWSTVHTFVKHCVLRRAVGCPSWNLENYSWTIIKHTCTGFLHKRSYTKVQEGLSKRVQTAFTLDIASSLMLQQMAATISHFHCRLQRNGVVDQEFSTELQVSILTYQFQSYKLKITCGHHQLKPDFSQKELISAALQGNIFFMSLSL